LNRQEEEKETKKQKEEEEVEDDQEEEEETGCEDIDPVMEFCQYGDESLVITNPANLLTN
jgi:hypothetical protein